MKSFHELLKEKKGIAIKAALRKKISKAVHSILKPTYFKSVPLSDISDALKREGVVMVQEDDTEWSGMLLGSEGRATIHLASANEFDETMRSKFYRPYTNVMLVLTWYKDSTRKDGKMEVVGYIS